MNSHRQSRWLSDELVVLFLIVAMAEIEDLRQRILFLEAENQKLRYAASLASSHQMSHILTAIWKFADAHDNCLPEKPSQLRPYFDDNDWPLMLSPMNKPEQNLSADTAWSKLDDLSSYDLHSGRRNDSKSVVLSEKRGLSIALFTNEQPQERRWYFFGDGHGQLCTEYELRDWLRPDESG